MTDRRRFPWKRRLGIVVLIIAALGVGGWFAWQKIVFPRLFASAGWSSNGITSSSFWWSDGDRSMIVGWPERVKTHDNPLFLAILRFPKDEQHGYSDHTTNSGDEYSIEIGGWVQVGSNEKWEAKYEVSSQPIKEKFTAGVRSFEPVVGRLFLVDLTAQPPRVEQVQVDLQKLLKTRPKDQNEAKAILQTALEALRKEQTAVREFVK